MVRLYIVASKQNLWKLSILKIYYFFINFFEKKWNDRQCDDQELWETDSRKNLI